MLSVIPLTLSLLAQTAAAQTAPAQTAPAATAAQEKPRFEDEILAFEAADKKAMPAPGKIVFVGSSSIRLWTTLAADFPEYDTLNRGFGGSWMADSSRLVDRIVLPYKPKAVVIFAGTNDLADGHTPDAVVGNYRAFVAKIRARDRLVPIAFIAITPAPSRQALWVKMVEVNRRVAEFTKRMKHLYFVDTYAALLTPEGGPRPELFVADQLHMQAGGYAIWKEYVGKTLHEMLDAPKK